MRKFNKKIALLEFMLNLVEQKVLTKKQAVMCYNNFSWRFFEFEINHWLVNLNCNKDKFTSLEKQLENIKERR